MFAPLPSDFPKLALLVQSMDVVEVVAPPPIEAIGLRLRAAFVRSRSDQYQSLSISELRKLPFAYWIPAAPPLPRVDPALVQRYWDEVLPQAINGGPRRAKRWLAPLFFSYCDSFDAEDEYFNEYANYVIRAVNHGEGAYAMKLSDMQRDVAFFQPALVPTKLALALLTHPRLLEEAMAEFMLWPGFVDTRLGAAVFGSALGLGAQWFSDWHVIARVLDWAKRLATPVQKSRFRVRFADALLLPWFRQRPPDTVKAVLLGFFIREYGDPRMAGHREYQWSGVSPDALSVLMRWLTGDTLRGFMRVLERTADDIWRHRRKFWMAFYDAGHIEEAWLALGSDAQALVGNLKINERGMGFGALDSGAASNQSVLILKLGHIVFTEWSHNGSLRAYLDGDPGTPRLYQSHYSGMDLREPTSLDFHDGANLKPELRHVNSAGGTWQRKARDFIRQHTGVYVGDREIL